MLKTVSSITNAIGSLNYKGTWNASTNTPTLVSSVGVKGDYYQVSVAGSTTINGISNWGVGDVIAFNDSTWQRIEGGADLNGVNLSVSGTTTLSVLTASTALALDANKNIISVTNTGTGNNVLATAPTLIGDVTVSTGKLIVVADNLVAGSASGSGARLSIDGGEYVASYAKNGTLASQIYIGGTIASGSNGANAIYFIQKDSATSRSINAAGTLNAIGTDYAEYMHKSGEFTIQKGDICGINSSGMLTNVFDNAVSFVVKSTNPSFVGGDTWGTFESIGLQMPVIGEKPSHVSDQEWQTTVKKYQDDKTIFDAAIEVARSKVDRVAFCGQVPVNVSGALSGQFIVPTKKVDGSISAIAVFSPSFEQYQLAVGKVIAVEQDGRARIIVKIS